LESIKICGNLQHLDIAISVAQKCENIIVLCVLIDIQWFIAGFCLKTKTDSGNKVFINVCQGANVSDCSLYTVKCSVIFL